jgi:nucleoside-diphosphate-sugar epimerase
VPRALVTGGTGLVGSHVIERLVRDGWSVRALVRSHSRLVETLGGECVTGDVLDADAFARAAAGCDAIFHNAAAVTPSGGWEAFRRTNVDGTINAIAAARASGARLVHLSSVAVYGPAARYRDDGLKTDEATPLAPLPERAYYARSKRDSEELVMRAYAAGDIWATALRPTVIYGDRDRQFVPRVARLLSRGIVPLVGGGVTKFSIVHAANVADGVVRAATRDAAAGRAYNLANDFDVTVRRFFELAGEGLGRRIRFVRLPTPIARGTLRAVKAITRALTGGKMSAVSSASLAWLTRDNPFTSERARAELGWAPSVRPEIGVPEAFRWWREHRSPANS